MDIAIGELTPRFDSLHESIRSHVGNEDKTSYLIQVSGSNY